MSIDGKQDVEGLKRIGAVVAAARDAMGAQVAPGVTTAELDAIGKEILDLDGYWADTGASFPVGAVSAQASALLRATRLALEDGMLEAQAGKPLRNIGRAVERRAKRCGFRVVRNLCGHGVGRHIHEDPQVPNTFNPKDRHVLQEGLVITIEPFLTTGATIAVEGDDGWTLRTPDGSRGAQFEHTMIITRGRPIVVT
jgi:methionyl aminopeptidase